MESKNAAILLLAVLAAAVITASATYAMTGRPAGTIGGPNPGPTYGYGIGPAMMGGYPGSYGMMGAYAYHYGVHQYTGQCWNSTLAP